MIDHSLSVDSFGGYVEPWTPKVGDRVRVRISGECNRPNHWDSWANDLGVKTGHLPICHGMTGIVFRIDARDDQHSYAVEFFDPLPWTEPFAADRFAAIELEPIGGDL